MEWPRGAGTRTGTLLGENAQELLSKGQEMTSCSEAAVQQVAKGLVGAGAKAKSSAAGGSVANESVQMVLDWTLPWDAYNFVRSFRFQNDDIKVVFAAQTAVGGTFD